MPEHGVVFPASTRHPMEAALAACARPGTMGNTSPPSTAAAPVRHTGPVRHTAPVKHIAPVKAAQPLR